MTACHLGSRVAAHSAQWEHLHHQIQLVGDRINQIWNILGNDYDLMFLGQADDSKTLHRIDAVCKTEGYASKTHPAIGGKKTSPAPSVYNLIRSVYN